MLLCVNLPETVFVDGYDELTWNIKFTLVHPCINLSQKLKEIQNLLFSARLFQRKILRRFKFFLILTRMLSVDLAKPELMFKRADR